MQGIKLDLNDYNEEDEHGDVLCIIRQRRLDILHSEGFIMERILKTLKSPNILWIRWKGYPNSSFPSWIPMNNLNILHVFGSVLNTLWQSEVETQVNINFCQYLYV